MKCVKLFFMVTMEKGPVPIIHEKQTLKVKYAKVRQWGLATEDKTLIVVRKFKMWYFFPSILDWVYAILSVDICLTHSVISFSAYTFYRLFFFTGFMLFISLCLFFINHTLSCFMAKCSVMNTSSIIRNTKMTQHNSALWAILL